MIIGYVTNVPAYRPLMTLLDGFLLTSSEVGAHLRYSDEHMCNMRKANKGPPWFKLATGGIRYSANEMLAWQLSSTQGPLTLERVTLAIAGCAAVPIEHRSALIEHLNEALKPTGK